MSLIASRPRARARRSSGLPSGGKQLLAAVMLALGLLYLHFTAFVPGPGRAGDASHSLRRLLRRRGVQRQALLEQLSGKLAAETDAFKEIDRRSRRDVFSYQDWKKHRSTTRYFRNLETAFSSSFARFIWMQVTFSTLAAALVCLYYDGLAAFLPLPEALAEALGGHEAPKISSLAFTVTSAVLSLLLVFRTNQSFDRWWEARKIWGSITNKCRDLTRQGLARVKEKDEALKLQIVSLTSSFPRVLMFHLGARDATAEAELDQNLHRLLPAEEAALIMAATHKPMTTLGLVTEKFAQANLHPIEQMKADAVISDLTDFYGMCERIFKSPIPLVYTRFTSRFLSVWLLALPFALYRDTSPHYLIVLITGIVAFFTFGIAEVGFQIEEPFSILPLQSMCEGIEASLTEALELNKQRRLKQ